MFRGTLCRLGSPVADNLLISSSSGHLSSVDDFQSCLQLWKVFPQNTISYKKEFLFCEQLLTFEASNKPVKWPSAAT